MKVLNGREARASQDPQPGNGTESGFPAIDAATIAKYAGQAAVKLGAMGASSSKETTSGKALGAAGEGLRDAGMGAGIGASIGSVIPGIGTVIGGAIGAIGGAIVGVIHFLFGAGQRELTANERDALKRGLHIYTTRHLPGAFQDAVLYVYSPVAYHALRSVGRLPSEIEAQLLKERSYAAHARELERLHGARLRRELAHLPPDFRTLVGVGSITGHSRPLYVALRCALAQPTRRQLHLALPSRIVASPAPSEILAPPEPTAPYNLAPEWQPQDIASARPAAPLAAVPVVAATDNEAGAVPGSPVVMRSVVEVFDAGDAVFAWRPIAVSFKRHPHDSSAQTLLGTFWVFVDAMKDRTTGRRCPCSAAETQLVADTLRVAPGHLPQWWGPLGGEELPCLLMTTRLLCARWLNAKQVGEIIAPHPFSTSDLLITGCTLTDRAIDADLTQFVRPDPWVADPGKIWALHRRLFDGTAEAVNYGWHFDPVLTPIAMPGSTNAAIPGMSLLQSAGGTHSADHLDYSQKLLLVAPWCMVAAPGQDRMVPMRTADVYQSPEFAGLVTDDAQPLRSVRQPFDPNRMHAAREAFWAEQERIYEDKKRRGLELLDVLPHTDKARGPPRLDRPTAGSRAQPTSSGVPDGTYAASGHDPFASLQTSRRL
jgi:hypothetical protein